MFPVGLDGELCFYYILTPLPLQLHLYTCYDFNCLSLVIGKQLKTKFVRRNKSLELSNSSFHMKIIISLLITTGLRQVKVLYKSFDGTRLKRNQFMIIPLPLDKGIIWGY